MILAIRQFSGGERLYGLHVALDVAIKNLLASGVEIKNAEAAADACFFFIDISPLTAFLSATAEYQGLPERRISLLHCQDVPGPHRGCRPCSLRSSQATSGQAGQGQIQPAPWLAGFWRSLRPAVRCL